MTSRLPFSATFLTLLFLMIISSCHDDVDCIKGDYLFLRYMHNGQNAIFGDQAIVERDSITFSTSEGKDLQENLSFVDSTMTIRVLLYPSDSLYLLHFENQHTDTFKVVDWLFPLGRECSISIIKSAQLNGEVLCEFDCSEVIEVMF